MLSFAYAVRVSTRARRCSIHVGPRGVTLVVPRRMPVRDAESFLRSNADWVRRRMEALRRNAPAPLPPGTVLYRGEPLPAAIPPDRMERWLKRQARSLLAAEVQRQASRMRLHPKRISVRDQRTRWGSCSTTGTLSLSWRLVMAPPEVMAYVVIHELAHLAEHNHGPRFWSLVEQHCPDYRAHKAWLRRHGALLHTF
jgi:predicted metal-dependent hydrolase